MAFTELSEVIARHKLEVCQNSAVEIQRQQLVPYSQMDLAKLAQLFVPTLEMIAHYLLTGEATEYRNYLTKLAEQRISNGFGVDEILKVSRIVEAELIKIINQEFAEPAQANARQRYIRRIESINMLTNAAIVTTRIKYGKS